MIPKEVQLFKPCFRSWSRARAHPARVSVHQSFVALVRPRPHVPQGFVHNVRAPTALPLPDASLLFPQQVAVKVQPGLNMTVTPDYIDGVGGAVELTWAGYGFGAKWDWVSDCVTCGCTRA